NRAWKALGVIGPSRSVMNTCEDAPCSRCNRPQCAYFVALDRMNARRTILRPADVHAACGQLDLRPLQVAQLRGPQSVPVADQDHGGIPVAVTARLPSCGHQALDLGLGQILTSPN